MFRFVALFALVAVALAEPEADAQVFVHPYNTVGVNGVPLVNTYTNGVNGVPLVNTYTNVVNPVVPVVKPVVPVVKYSMPVAKAPVVKYINPHHTEGMTKEGVPEKTASVKIAEKQHEIAQVVEDSKVKEVQGYVAPYTTYAGVVSPVAGVVSPYVNYPYGHLIHKREADSESDAAYLLTNTYAGLTNTYPYNYNYYNAYNPVVSPVVSSTGYHYQAAPVVAHTPVYSAHHLGKREADSDAQYFYRHYTPYSYTNGYYPYTYNNAYNGYRNTYGWAYWTIKKNFAS